MGRDGSTFHRDIEFVERQPLDLGRQPVGLRHAAADPYSI
jgi:hypothetical protein